MIFPNDATGDALKQFMDSGFNLSQPMEIDFFILIPSEELGLQFAKHIENLEFSTSVEQDDESKNWTCYCTKTMIPKYEDIILIENQLSRLAEPFHGVLDGFGSFGN